MALQLSFTDKYYVTHSTAYWRLTYWGVDLLGHNAHVNIAVYHDAATRTAHPEAPIEVKSYIFPYDENEPGALPLPELATLVTNMHGDVGDGDYIYTQLKTLAEFSGAQDV